MKQICRFEVQSGKQDAEISLIEWSPDDDFILIFMPKKNQVHLRHINENAIEKKEGDQNDHSLGWTGKIEESLAGIVHALWAPDSRQILTFSDNNLRLTIWSLVEAK